MSENPADSELVEALAEEFLQRRRCGELPEVSEYVSLYPHLAREIRAFFPVLGLLEDHKPGSRDLTNGDASERSRADDAVPERLGDFRILREVGRGGMGVVYEAEQETLGRRVALKVLVANRLLAPKLLARFDREAKAAARLHHTNIVPVFGVGEAEGFHFYVMQFIQGLGLDQVLDEIRHISKAGAPGVRPTLSVAGTPAAGDLTRSLASGHFAGAIREGSSGPAPDSPRRDAPGTEPGWTDLSASSVSSTRYCQSVARVGLQAAEALGYAHDQGILHRDVKPANLLLDAQGTVWVADFGLAKSVADTSLTHTGDLVGTLRYMAPERFRGECDARSDTYALGLTLYELLAKRPAFEAKDRNTLIREVTQTEPRRLSSLGLPIPRDLATIVQKAIAREPFDRYQTAGELAADLRRFLDDRSIAARRAGPVELTWRWCRRNPAVACLLSLIALLVVGSLAASLTAARRFNRIAESERSARAEAIRHADDTAAILRFIVDDMLRSAEPDRTQGRPVTVNEVLDRADRAIEGQFTGRPLVEASIRQTLGTVNFNLSMHEKSREHFARALALRTEHLGRDDPETLDSAHGLAYVLHEGLRRYDEAKSIYEATAERRRRVLGEEHPSTLETRLRLGVLLDNGYRDPKAAQSVIGRVLEIRSRSLGPNHPDTDEAKLLLGNALLRDGQTQEARSQFRQAYNDWRQAHGPDALGTLQAVDGLARCDVSENRLDEANGLYQQLLTARRRVQGEEHPATLSAMACIAGILVRQGRLENAEAIYRKALEIGRRVQGPDHPANFWRMDELAAVLFRRSLPEEACALLEQALESRRRVSGPEHPDTLVAMGSYAGMLFDHGHRARARELDEERVRVYRKVRGAGQPQTMNAMNGLAWHLVAVADPSLGDREIARAIELATAAVESAPERGHFWNTLGVARYRNRDWTGAIAALQRANRLQGDPAFGHNAFVLAMAYFQHGKEAEARRYFEQAMTWADRNGPDDPELLRLRAEAAALLVPPGDGNARGSGDGPKSRRRP